MKYLGVLVFLGLCAQVSSADQLLVGVAEQSDYPRRQGPAIVRAMFWKSDGQWGTLDDQVLFSKYVPYEFTWYLAFDGKSLGEINTIDNLNSVKDEYSWNFKSDKLLKIDDIDSFPIMENKDSRFGGWRGLPNIRPLVVVSKSNYKDNDNWKLYKPVEELEQLYPFVKEQIPQAYHCNGAPNWDATKIKLDVEDVSFFRSYKNNKNQKLISIGVNNKHTKDCDGVLDQTHKPMWFYVAEKTVKFVGFELELVDAGDYDADGEVEFVFWHGGYNRDGYTLYETEFEERFDYYWSYH